MNGRKAFGQLRLCTVLSLLMALIAYRNPVFASPASNLDSISGSPKSLQRGVRAAIEPIKEVAFDEREYRLLRRHLTLDSNMTILLISDPAAKTESAAMAVNVGFMHDPKAVPGLAHFTEHMLFRSTSESFPQENSLRLFLDQNFGKWSATTWDEETIFNFYVSNGRLHEALDRFAQLFISPLFSKTVVDQEINAIENEFALATANNLKRVYHLLKSTSDPTHPFSTFGIGNIKTLKEAPERAGIDSLQALREFFDNHYSAERMHLVVLGKDSLDELQSTVVEQFSAVPNRGHKPQPVTRMPYLKSSLPAIFRIVPQFEKHSGLRVFWQVPATRHHYREKPLQFISRLLSLGGKGSITSVLRQKGLPMNCISAVYTPSTGFSLLEFSVVGYHSNFKEVLNIVFAYLSMLRKVDTNTLESNYMDLHESRLSDFVYSAKSSSAQYCLTLAQNMRVSEPIDCVRAQGFLKFNDTLVRDYLAYLSPENARVHLTSSDFQEQADITEPWFDIKYSVEYPARFVGFEPSPTSYDVFLPPVLPPPPPQQQQGSEGALEGASSRQGASMGELLSDGIGHRLWYHTSSSASAVPKLALKARFSSRFTMGSSRNFLITRLFVSLFTSALGAMLEDKSLGKYWQLSLDPVDSGLDLHISAPRGDIRNVFYEFLHKINSFALAPVDSEIFETHKKALHMQFEERTSLDISYLATRVYFLSTFSDFSLHSKLYEDLSLISFRCMAESIPAILEEGFWEILVYGDVDQQEALDFADDLLQLTLTPMPHQFVRPIKVLKLPAGTVSVKRTEPVSGDKNLCANVNFQMGQFCPEVASKSQLLEILFSPYLYYELRDRQQLGYVVKSSIEVEGNMVRFSILVVSSQYSGVYLAHRIEEFCRSFRATLAAMSEEQFSSVLSSVLSALEAPRAFEQESSELSLLWNAGNSRCLFDMRRDAIAELSTLRLSDMVEFYDRVVAPGAVDRRVFASIIDPASASPSESVYDDIYPDQEVVVMRSTNEYRSSPDEPGLAWF